jgi:membrane protein YdbS with pleckstrin-like domain
MSASTRSLVDKVRVWFAPPEWRPADLGGPVTVPPADPAKHPRYDPRAAKGLRAYVAAQFVIAAAATVAYLWVESTARPAFLAACAVVFIATLAAWGALLEQKRWAWALEIARLAAGAGLVVLARKGA